MTRFRISVTYEVDAQPELIGRMCDDILGTIQQGLESKLADGEEITICPGARFNVVANPSSKESQAMTPIELARAYVLGHRYPDHEHLELARALIAATEALETARWDALLEAADAFDREHFRCGFSKWLRARATEVK